MTEKEQKLFSDILGKLENIPANISDILKEYAYGKRYSFLPQDTLIAEVVKNINEPYKVFEFDSSVANANPIEFGFKGAVFQVIDCRTTAGILDANSYIDVRFNSPQANPIRFRLGYRIVTPFQKIWVSNPAQAGIIFTIGMGLEFDNIYQFDFPVTPTAMQLTSLLSSVRSLNPDTGTQILKSATQINTAVSIMYTVSALKTLYITGYNFSAIQVGGPAYLTIRNAGDVFVACLATIWPPNGNYIIGRNCNYPIRVPAGYDICLTNDGNAGNYCHGEIEGWEE